MTINDPHTLRFGLFENLYGHDAIAGFRGARPNVDLARTLKNTVITTYGTDFATANTEFVKHDSGRAGRQSHTWLRTPDGWRSTPSEISLDIDASAKANAEATISIPSNWSNLLPRVAIALDVMADGKYLGQIAEAVVDIRAQRT